MRRVTVLGAGGGCHGRFIIMLHRGRFMIPIHVAASASIQYISDGCARRCHRLFSILMYMIRCGNDFFILRATNLARTLFQTVLPFFGFRHSFPRTPLMSCGLRRGVSVGISASIAGVGGVTVLGTGGIGHGRFIIMPQGGGQNRAANGTGLILGTGGFVAGMMTHHVYRIQLHRHHHIINRDRMEALFLILRQWSFLQ